MLITEEYREVYSRVSAIILPSCNNPYVEIKHNYVKSQSSRCGSAVTNPTNIYEDAGSIPGLAQWVKDPVLP